MELVLLHAFKSIIVSCVILGGMLYGIRVISNNTANE